MPVPYCAIPSFAIFLFLFMLPYHNAVAINNSAAPLRNVEVSQPPRLPAAGAISCTVPLLTHTFGDSFGQPATAAYSAPTDCGAVGSWSQIVLNLTVTSNGTQFDRLASLYLADTEIWRTSTAEPTPGAGIIWSAFKDVSRYMPLFALDSSSIIFDLPNGLQGSPDTVLDGQYSVQLSAVFYESSSASPAFPAANLIMPIANPGAGTGARVAVPGVASVNLNIPKNAITAVAEIYASGTGDDEFWYTSIANEFASAPTGNPSDVRTNGPMREVQLLIDGKLAGVALPFPVIFTGGLLPDLWRPIAAYGAFDQPTYLVDLTAWLPLLCNSEPHTFGLSVAGLGNDEINNSWLLSGNIALTLDTNPDATTTGQMTNYTAEPFVTPSITGQTSSSEVPVTEVTVSGTRDLLIESTVITSEGSKTVTWQQNWAYSNLQGWQDNAATETISQSSTGTSTAHHGDSTFLDETFGYPLDVLVSARQNTMTASANHTFSRRRTLPGSIGLSDDINTTQNSFAILDFADDGTVSGGTSATSQSLQFADSTSATFERKASAGRGAIISDQQSGSLATSPFALTGAPEPENTLFSQNMFKSGNSLVGTPFSALLFRWPNYDVSSGPPSTLTSPAKAASNAAGGLYDFKEMARLGGVYVASSKRSHILVVRCVAMGLGLGHGHIY